MIDRLLEDLEAEREAFLAVLAEVDADLVTVPGVVGDWSVRDVVVHVAAWADHASRALDLATDGRGADFDYDDTQTDAMNERILADGRSVSPADALVREAAAFTGFRERVARLDRALLGTRLGNGDTLEEVVRYDGPDHYAEHAEHLRAWFAVEADEDDGDADDGDA